MSHYKEQPSIPTGIHTRINDTLRISSAWREFGNGHFNNSAWETFLWEGDNIKEEYYTFLNAESVIDLHMKIYRQYTDTPVQEDRDDD